MKDTIVIAFHGGCYGAYLEWCLTTLCNNNTLQEPFDANGTSHNFLGNQLLDIDQWQRYVQSPCQFQFARLHPKVKKTHDISENIIKISENASHVICLYPDQSTMLLSINNVFYKIWDCWIKNQFTTIIDQRKIYDIWPVSENIPIDQVPRWIIREFLSFYLMPSWFDQIEWDRRSQWSYPKSTIITVSELLFDFNSTLLKIEKFCNIKYCRPITDLIPSHQKNLELQKYIDQDSVCYQIIDAVMRDNNLDWATLPLPSEAWIQWELRNRGFEIQCHGLDTFPTNSVQLKQLLYPV